MMWALAPRCLVPPMRRQRFRAFRLLVKQRRPCPWSVGRTCAGDPEGFGNWQDAAGVKALEDQGISNMKFASLRRHRRVILKAFRGEKRVVKVGSNSKSSRAEQTMSLSMRDLWTPASKQGEAILYSMALECSAGAFAMIMNLPQTQSAVQRIC